MIVDTPAIRVESLGKRYRLGERAAHDTLRDAIGSLTNILGARRRGVDECGRVILEALADVSFTVQRGEVVGVIGRNGAGKSTLLKILSRITAPSSGCARILGRVGSLLEVGTGFHPELTGRENIFLNGAILGMRRREIEEKFDRIVDFSEIATFLDTPVKRYSSGMYTRLAFAVAAHLDPEILLVDEVLAVGDVAFQQKCLGKIDDVARSGRTVLFVSHNMATVRSLCSRCLVLRGGRLIFDGATDEAISLYVSQASSGGEERGVGTFDLSQRKNDYGNRELIRSLRVLDSDGHPAETLLMGSPMRIELETEGISEFRSAQVGVMIKTESEVRVCNFNTGMSPPARNPGEGRQVFRLDIPRIPLAPGPYWIDAAVAQKSSGRLDFVDRAGKFFVEQSDVYGSGYQLKRGDGVIFLDGSWTTLPAEPLAGDPAP